MSFTLNAGTPARYYVFRAVAGRSYCAEMVTTAETSVVADSSMAIYRQSQAIAVSNDNTTEEPLSGANAPAGGGLSRACYIAPASESLYVFVSQPNPASTIQWQARLVETTLFSNWFFVAGDYSAFTLIRNTTSSVLNYTVNWRNGAGTIVATSNDSLNGNAGIFLDARSFPLAIASVSGTVEIVHNSSPDALVASTTVLSGTTGLSFDVPFVRRQPW